MTRRIIWRIEITVAVAAALVLYAGAAYGTTIEIPIDTIHRGNPGDLFHEGTIPANPGDQCTAELESRNNESMHPDSDILVGPVIFRDVESAAFQAAGQTFTAIGDVEVFTRLGPDGVFSAGFILEVTCNPPELSSTTTTASVTPG